MSHPFRWQERLSVQTIITLLGLVILTAFAIGIPVLWILRSQLEIQAWELVTLGNQTSLALLDNRQSDLDNLAILTAQRPTLRRLVEEGDLNELSPYLQTLQEGGGMDVLVLCTADAELFVLIGRSISEQACRQAPQAFFDSEHERGQAWLLASAETPLSEGSIMVVVGRAIDDRFMMQLGSEIGFEQILFYEGAYIASSFPDGSPIILENAQEQFVLEHAGQSYFAQIAFYEPNGLEWVTAKPALSVLEARRQLTWTVVLGILAVVAVGSSLGVARARLITRPLEQLKRSADRLRLGQLENPIRVETQIYELALLSYALEDARLEINHTLAELKKEKAWTEHILESVVEGIMTLDRNRQITFFSHGAEEITGWKAEEVLGRDVDEIFPLYQSEELFSRRLPNPGGKQKIVVWLPRQPEMPGRPVTLAVTGARLAPPEAGKADIGLVLRDVSNEEAIRRLLGEFLANISHEFRTPLTALAASIELLLDQLPDLNQKELHELLDNIHLGTISLQHLIDNLLEGASIETGRFRVVVKTTRIEEIVSEAARLIGPLVQKYGLSLRLVIPPGLPVLADYRRSVQSVVNLLSNAVKWSPGGSEILLEIERKDDRVEVRICDRGPGVPEENMSDLFHRFGQIPGIKPVQSTGLGLSVVKAIIEAQGGQVGVRNRPGGGAEFWFTLFSSHEKDNNESASGR